MAKRLQHRGGTTSQHSTFTGAVREVTVDTDKNTLVVHDGATAGGHPLATATNFTSTGIDDNATSTAITIDSSERVGIGTTSPQKTFVVSNGGAEGFEISPTDVSATIRQIAYNRSTSSHLAFRYGALQHEFHVSDQEKMRIDSSGNVGIGTSSPSSLLHIFSSAPKLIIQDGGTHGTNSAPRLEFKDSSSIQGFVEFADDGTMRIDQLKAYPLTFLTNNVERMRITSGGHLLIGTTTDYAVSSSTVTGSKIRSDGIASFFRDNATPLYVGRQNGYGTLIDFRASGTSIGSIGTRYGYTRIGVSNTNLIFDSGNDRIAPSNGTTFAAQDNTTTLGWSDRRFKDLYLGGGLYVGGTGSANYLDDYEEGSWTPVCVGSTTAGTVTMNGSYTRGRYTKIGNTVYIHCVVVWSSLTGTGNLRITGLPFTSRNIGSSNNVNASHTSYNNLTVPSDSTAYARIFNNSSEIGIASQTTGTSNIANLTVDATGELYFNITYTTDA